MGPKSRRSTTPETAESLNKFVRLYRQGSAPGDPLFVSERGGRLSYMSLYSKIRTVGTKAGIGSLYPQMLRHTYLVRLYDATQDLRLVQLQAGHAQSATTARYAKYSRRKSRGRLCVGDAMAGSGNQSSSPTPAERTTDTTSVSSPSTSEHMNDECEACGTPISTKMAKRIDSGQLLCPDCFEEIRSKSSGGRHSTI
jgi:hypothetical protein